MKWVVDVREVWVQSVLVDADCATEAVEKVVRGEGEDIDDWFELSHRKPEGINPRPFNQELHTLPTDHPYRKYLKSPIVEQAAKEAGVPVIDIKMTPMNPDDLVGMPMSVGEGKSWAPEQMVSDHYVPSDEDKFDKLPDFAIFPAPDVCTAQWSDKDWVRFWLNSGGRVKK